MIHETVQWSPPPLPPAEPVVDHYLICLQAIAAHYGLSNSATILTAGLPLQNGILSLANLGKAAGRVGLDATPAEKQSLRRIPRVDLPAILLRRDGSPVVLVSFEKHALNVFFPEEGMPRLISPKAFKDEYSGTWVRVRPFYSSPETDATKRENRHWFWSVAGQYKRSYGRVILAATVINIIALLSPLFFMNVYDRVIPNKATTTLWVFVAGLTTALVFDFLLKIARARVVDRIGRKIDIQVACNLLEKILQTRLMARPATAGILANRMQEYELIREFLSSSTLMLIVDLSFFALFSLVIYLIAGWLVVIPLLALAVVVTLGLLMQKQLARVVQRAQDESALRHSVLVESIASLETIKSIRAESYVLGRWEKFAGAAAESSESAKDLTSIAMHSTGFVQQIVSILVVVAGVYQFSEGHASMGAIIAAVMLSNKLVAPLSQVSMMFARFHYVRMAFAHFNDIMGKPDEQIRGGSFVNRSIEAGRIEFRNVSFAYPGATSPVLKGLNLAIRPGEKVGIIGKIGSGKTTLGRLLTGLYVPQEGEILVDGIDVRQYHPHEVRSAIAFVAQDADIFFGSVRENMMMANARATDFEIVRAAQLAGVDEFVSAHPQGYDLQVGERGARLSGGQRQCIALARAFLANPRVVFLDEPSSSMDLQAERQFIERLRTALNPETTLIIATHRQSMLQLVDRLIVLDQGKIVRDGPCGSVLQSLRGPGGGERQSA